MYGDDVAIVFKHRPLPFHKFAMGAALAMQAANRQGKAWEMHDLMFQNRQALGRAALEGYAGQLELDVEQFKKDLDDPKLKAEVDADNEIAVAVGARGTPTFFINGKAVVGALPFEKFKEVIDPQLAEANKLVEQGTPVEELYDKLSPPPKAPEKKPEAK